MITTALCIILLYMSITVHCVVTNGMTGCPAKMEFQGCEHHAQHTHTYLLFPFTLHSPGWYLFIYILHFFFNACRHMFALLHCILHFCIAFSFGFLFDFTWIIHPMFLFSRNAHTYIQEVHFTEFPVIRRLALPVHSLRFQYCYPALLWVCLVLGIGECTGSGWLTMQCGGLQE